MGWPVCNTTLEDTTIEEVELWDGGITFHKLCLVIGGFFAIIAGGVSIYLIMCHANHYSKPTEQRHIIRILWMIPIYSLVAWLGTYYYKNAIYYNVIGDCYEAFTISAFFALMCHYVAPDLHSQKNYFRGIEPKPWVWPITWLNRGCCARLWRTPRSGLTWFNVVWVGVFQYCFLRVLMTIVAVVTQTFGVYCESTFNPAFAHFWVLGVECIAVTIAMFCLIQFYIQIKEDIDHHRPFLKILSIKLVIFLSFWQSSLISFLFSTGIIEATPKLQANDLQIGLPNLLIAIEMALFAVLHLWAFAWQSYSLETNQPNEVSDLFGNGKTTYKGGFWGLKAILDSINPLDLIKAVGRSMRWLFVGRKKRTLDSSYQTSSEAIGMSATATNTNGTQYQGAGAGATVAGGRTQRYGSTPDEEGDILLSHAQSNPGSHSSVNLGAPPPYEEDRPFYTQDRLSSVSLLDPGARSPQPYSPSPYEDMFNNPYMVPSDSENDHPQQPAGPLSHNNIQSAQPPYPSDHSPYPSGHTPYPSDHPPYPSDHAPYPSGHQLQEQAPIPLPDSYRPPSPERGRR